MKYALRTLSLCHRLLHKLDQTTEQKTRERLKSSNIENFKILSDFITATSFKRTVFQMLMATIFLQNETLIKTFNLPVLFVIGNFTYFCAICTLSRDTLSLFSVY